MPLKDTPVELVTEPEVRQTRSGWVASSGAGSSLRIGVRGRTAEEARTRFDASVGRWRELIAKARG